MIEQPEFDMDTISTTQFVIEAHKKPPVWKAYFLAREGILVFPELADLTIETFHRDYPADITYLNWLAEIRDEQLERIVVVNFESKQAEVA